MEALAQSNLEGLHLKVVAIEVEDTVVNAGLFVEYAGEQRSATARWEGSWLLADDGRLDSDKVGTETLSRGARESGAPF